MGSGEVAIVALSTMISLKVTFSDGLGGVSYEIYAYHLILLVSLSSIIVTGLSKYVSYDIAVLFSYIVSLLSVFVLSVFSSFVTKKFYNPLISKLLKQ